MHLAELWRYPVKSMAGEPLERATVTELGLEGDRIVHVETDGGRVITSRTHPRLLGHNGTLGAAGVLVDGRPWDAPSVTDDVVAIVGTGARLVVDETADRFDVLPLLVATDGAIQAFGHDRRRLRPNLVIAGVEGLAERTWEGRRLRVGGVEIGIEELRMRCVMTTFDPDTQAQDHGVLRSIVQRFGGRLALDAFVVRGGELRVGDPVEVV